MKKTYFGSVASAVVVAASFGMTSCSSSDVTDDGNTVDTGERSVVKTQFAINIPYSGDNSSDGTKAGTRMTAENTQNQTGTGGGANYNNFRGIENMILLAFNGTPGTIGHTTATKLINIGSGNNAYEKGIYTSIYRDIEIPVGTTHFIMNGRAMRTKKGASQESTNFEIGRITVPDNYSNIQDLSKLTFSLTPINKSVDFSNNSIANTIIEQLNKIASVSVTDGEDSAQQTIKWSSLTGDKNGDAEWPNWIIQNRKFLAERYNRFVSLSAGSMFSVKTAIQNLQQVLVGDEGTATDPVTTIPADKKLTIAIYNACSEALDELNNITEEFPRNLDLPDGVAKLSFSNGQFSYCAASNIVIGQDGNHINYNQICYPAEISYFINTKAKTSTSDITSISNLPGYAEWLKNDENTWSNTSFTDAAVSTATKSVALKDPIQYSVACLKTSVVCSSTTLKDNASGITAKYAVPLEDQDITVPNDGFKVRAILIGGQPEKVNWNFYPSSTEQFAYTIYDKDMNGNSSDQEGKYMAAKTSESDYNYTLVLDNKNSSTTNTSQSNVYVTLELQNDTQSFYGADGLIPANGRFYLVGVLSPSSTSGVTQPSTDSSIDRVFLQDHTTVAKFKITSLKKAYNCIPDLRTAGMNVGLAVDLEWKTGLTFAVEL